jgi:NADPH2:quinone reductase
MRAIVQTEFGGPEVLQLADVPEPEPAPGEVLIDVALAGVNFADTHQRENAYVQKASLPLIPGAEVAGTRRDTGERVIALTRTGGYAEVVAAPQDRVFAIPEGVDDATALALLLQGLTAWHLYRTMGRVAPGESVLVISGAGGVGSLAVQLGHPMGAGRVVATASTPEKRALCLELGADEAVASPRDLSDPVDVVFEMAGGDVFDAAMEVLAPLGRCVVYGISGREQREVRTGRLLKNSHAVIGFWLFHLIEDPRHLGPALHDLFARAARGELHAVVGPSYPLADAARAQEDLRARRTTGKLTIALS